MYNKNLLGISCSFSVFPTQKDSNAQPESALVNRILLLKYCGTLNVFTCFRTTKEVQNSFILEDWPILSQPTVKPVSWMLDWIDHKTLSSCRRLPYPMPESDRYYFLIYCIMGSQNSKKFLGSFFGIYMFKPDIGGQAERLAVTAGHMVWVPYTVPSHLGCQSLSDHRRQRISKETIVWIHSEHQGPCCNCMGSSKTTGEW